MTHRIERLGPTSLGKPAQLGLARLLAGNVIAIIALGLSVGCNPGSKAKADPEKFYGVTLVKSKPGEEPRCKCNQSQGVSAASNDPDKKRVINTSIAIHNLQTGAELSTTSREDILGPESSVFMGCTIAEDATPACNILNKFTIKTESVLNTATAKERSLNFPETFRNDAATCSKRCQAGGDCLDLGLAGAKMLGPFIEMLEASSGPPGTVSKAEIMKRFGMPESADTCSREDLLVDSNSVENRGPSGCKYNLSKFGSVMLPVDMRLAMEPRVVAIKGSLRSILPPSSVSQFLVFTDRQTSGTVEFFASGQTTEELDYKLMNLYGGTVLSAARIDKSVFVATTNGCVAARVP